MTDRSNRRIGIDPFVIGTLVAGLLIVLLLVFGNGSFLPDTKGLILGSSQTNIESATNSKSSKR